MPKVVLLTGVSGNLGSRLIPLLKDFSIIGVDIKPPRTDCRIRFERIDLAEESATSALIALIRDTQPVSVVHLAFLVNPLRADVKRMWQVNVAGTRRLLQAVAEVIARGENPVRQLIFCSSVAAYGPDSVCPVGEHSPLAAHSLPYAVQKKQADELVQQHSQSLAGCSVYILRPHIFVGASMENYQVQGAPKGEGVLADKMRRSKKRVPFLLPRGQKYLDNRIQFVHVDDMARLVEYILSRAPDLGKLTVLNVAGRGDPLTFADCIEAAQARLIQVPGKWSMRIILSLLWRLGISPLPPQAVPYLTGECIVDTACLRNFLGRAYEQVIRYTIADALADSLGSRPSELQTG